MAEWKKKKVKKTDWGDFYRSDEEFEAMRWCLKHGIKIGLLAVEKGKTNPSNFWIDIEIKGNKHRSPETWGSKEVWPQIYKYYKYYYDKHRKSI
jgi:hypothetical protein